MMKKWLLPIQNQPLRRNILLLFIAVAVVAVLVQLYYAASLYTYRKDRGTEEGRKLIRQTDMELDSLMERVSRTGMALAVNEVVQRYLLLQNEADKETVPLRTSLRKSILYYLEGSIDSNGYIDDIAIVTNTGEITSTNNAVNFVTYQLLDKEYHLAERHAPFFTPILNYHSKIWGERAFAYIFPVYDSRASTAATNRTGTVIVWCRQEVLERMVRSTSATEGSTVAVIDSANEIIAYNSVRPLSEMKDTVAAIAQAYGRKDAVVFQQMKVLEQTSYVLVKENEKTGWRSISITPLNDIFADTRRFLHQGIVLATVTIALTLAMAVLSVRNIVRPLAAIIGALKEQGASDRMLKVDGIKNNEFGLIVDSMNGMLQNVHELHEESLDMQKKLYETELMQKETELLALRSKIDPHFLNNTLECIRSIAVVRGAKEISVITSSMSRIFRYGTADSIFTSVRNELQCITDYDKIMSIRYSGRVKIRIEVEPGLLSCSMLKLSLQPLVENAVYHGMNGDSAGGGISIVIGGEADGRYAVITVRDNGAGMSADKLHEVNRRLSVASTDLNAQLKEKASHVGLANIHARIRLYYGDDCGLALEQGDNGGVTVRMRISLTSPQQPAAVFSSKGKWR
ncbi:MAG: signal transduction histidine kinase, LytS [Paenibacillaceae bacterium]|jgi:two-component system sensor histidine kinase YesM|nr:signal transduction histidine kinase, LytS [Paenibacillaceae bacterium]